MRIRTQIVGTLVFCAVFASLAWSGEIVVDPNGSFDHTTIQVAIDDSGTVAGDVVFVRPGRYVENIDMKGKSITLRSLDPNDPAVVAATIIDGNGAGSVVTCNFREDPNTLISGFTITNGSAVNGGGVYIDRSASLKLTYCTIIDNIATGYGGGVYDNDDSFLRMSYCTVSSNAAVRGGGVYSDNRSRNRINYCTFTENRASTGGALFHANYSYTSYKGCYISQNSPVQVAGTTNDNGGNTIIDPVWYVDDDAPASFATIQAAIDASTDGNTVTVMPGRYYGNIDMSGKSITLRSLDPTDPLVVTSTIIDGNDANSVITCNSGEDANTVISGFVITNGSGTSSTFEKLGGGMYNDSSSPTVTNCTFSGNEADYGGGIFNWLSSPTVSYCTFSGNKAYSGGGMCNNDHSHPTVSNCTFSDNEAGSKGGGMFNNASSPTVTESYFCFNAPDAIDGPLHGNSGGNTITEFCPPPGAVEAELFGDSDDDDDVDLIDFAAFAENWLEGTE